MSNVKKIGLFGFGTVGKGVYELLSKYYNLPAEISKVCVKRVDLERVNHSLYFTNDPSELLLDEDLDIIIEVISDADAAKEIIHRALASDKSVISANKKMIGSCINEVDSWHQAYPSNFFYEAAVGGGIPIIHSIEQVFKSQGITKIRGILNGSSNYILTQMNLNNQSFDSALADAQKKGFAEENPSLDVDGFDASFKLRILGYHAFGETIDLKSCSQESIRNVSSSDMKLAKKHNKKIKPVATLEKKNGVYSCSIKPELISSSDSIYPIDFEYNGIEIHTQVSGKHLLVGKGAGAMPTGSAIINDLKKALATPKFVDEQKIEIAFQ
jgi:homoserine dehydrogenase